MTVTAATHSPPEPAPGLAATGFFVALLAWNEVLVPGVGADVNAKVLPYYIAWFISARTLDWRPMAAASSVAIIPIAVLTVAIQRKLVAGLSQGALKERRRGRGEERALGDPARDAEGVVLVIEGAVLGVAGMALACWLSAAAVVTLLFDASFRAFADVAAERDGLSESLNSQVRLVALLANGCVKDETDYPNQTGG